MVQLMETELELITLCFEENKEYTDELLSKLDSNKYQKLYRNGKEYQFIKHVKDGIEIQEIRYGAYPIFINNLYLWEFNL